MKVNKAFRIPFITKKTIKKQTGFAKNFLEAPIQSIQRCLNPLFILALSVPCVKVRESRIIKASDDSS